MITFIEHLQEADYSRFLKKNRKLDDGQRKEINKYYSKTNTQAGSKIKWQSREVRNMSYDDFVNNMIRYKSGFKKKLKVRVPGSQGEDYWQIKLKTKGFLAYIPLTQETASFFNSGKFGTCETGHCIGHKDAPEYWDQHMIDNQEVPVYIVDGFGKWVVIIEDGNSSYQVWDKMNQNDISIKDKEPIPGFSIKKELMNSKLSRLYDEIREDFYDEDAENVEVDIDDAVNDYDSIIDDIEESAGEAVGAYDRFNEESYKIKIDTEGMYDEKILEKQDEKESLESNITDIEETIEGLEEVLEDFDDDDVEFVFVDGNELDEEGVEDLISSNNSDIETLEADIEIIDDEILDLEVLHDEIEDIEFYEMADSSVDWVRYPQSEEDIFDDINIPSCTDIEYSDYFVLMEEHGNGGNINSCDDDIRRYIYDSPFDSSELGSAYEILSNNDWYHPEILNMGD